ncbi:MAG: DUF4301 family protein [Paramuribaculum sp.]|nr:DUF4301 family protein [Paramuribaculum sp.]
MLRPEDKAMLESKGITEAQVEAQLERFRSGFPYLALVGAARPGQGIKVLDHESEESAIARWKEYLAHGGEVTKFVPASGAASRMFKALFEFVDSGVDKAPEGSAPAALLADLTKLPFLTELNVACERLYGADAAALHAAGRDREVIAAIILPDGMNYGALPKGLLKFHSYPDGSRTPVEEQLTEGAQTAAGADGKVRLHFTVSSNHRKLFEEKLNEAIPATTKRTGAQFEVTMSEQKPSTDTIAVNPDNTPFLEDGHLLFRPGGHGALIANLNDIDSEVVFIKNIDNVVPDSLRESTVRYKQVLAGYLMQIRDVIESYLVRLAAGDYTRDDLNAMVEWMKQELCITDERTATMSDVELAAFVQAKLNRPLRVCGMVKNEGEPGGGPFIAVNPDGSSSPQILESHQIDPSNEEYQKMLSEATHFNPVDLVCCIKDIHGHHFNLPDYVDPATGFISSKSSHGKELRALELPGLWNGAMSDWNTVFVEVPISTFNPVKTVNDLLRPAHQS